MNTNKLIELIEILKKCYPDAKCSLDFSTPFELLVAVMLSAQCTDERVNLVTPVLFSKYNKPEDFVNLDVTKLEKIIYSCGFYKNKAKNLIACSETLVNNYNGIVPQDIEVLTTLSGIGRKSANVIMLEAFNKPCGIAVDTHVKRISKRLGLSENTIPEKIEIDLLKIIPESYLKDVNHLFIYHGRKICTSQNPKCKDCPIKKLCSY